METAISNTPWRTRDRMIVLLSVFVLVFLAFGRSLLQGFAPFDDPFLIVDNLATKGISWQSLTLAFTTFDPELYIPFTLVSFQINAAIAGLEPFSYHLTNLLLHIANTLLLITLLFRITRSKMSAILVGFLFAVHPLTSEVVVWITSRKDLLSTFFSLLTFLLYIRPFHDIEKQNRTSMVRQAHHDVMYLFSILTFGCALLSKVSPFPFPFTLILYDLLLKRIPFRQSLRRVWPLLLVSFLFVGIGTFGKERLLSQSGVLPLMLTASRGIWVGVLKFLLPLWLSPIHPLSGAVSLANPRILLPILFTLVLILVVIRSMKRSPVLCFGLLFYGITLAPALLHVATGYGYNILPDRYGYFPSIGLFIALSALLMHLRWDSLRRRLIQWSGTAVIIVLAVFLSVRQTAAWDSPETLFTHIVNLYPMSTEARIGLSTVYRDRGDIERAFAILKDGLHYNDDDRLHLYAGYLYARANDVSAALEQFRRAAQMNPLNPDPVFAVASLHEQTGRRDLAKDGYERAITMDPSYVIARAKLAKIELDDGNIAAAQEQVREALRWNPSSKEAREVQREIFLMLQETHPE